MARILFCWELGGGFGHLMPYREIIRGLQQHGHEIWFASRSLQSAERAFAGMDVHLCQSPLNMTLPAQDCLTVQSYAHLLYNTLAHDVAVLTASIKGWRTLMELIQPDMLIVDHSPGAMLASHDLVCERVICGSGFLIPPSCDPWPNFPHLQPVDEAELIAFEEKLLGTVNSSLAAAGISPLKTLGETLLSDDELLMTYPELDQYTPRSNARYRGVPRIAEGQVPQWPAVDGKRIFAYLKDFDTMPALIETLVESKQPTLLRMNSGNEERYQQYECGSLKIITETIDLQALLSQADLYVCNANHTSVSESLLAGTPVLSIPLHLDQFILARNVELLGAGLSAPMRKPQGMAAKFHELLKNPIYAAAAKNFAKKYHSFSSQKELVKMLDAMLSRQRLH